MPAAVAFCRSCRLVSFASSASDGAGILSGVAERRTTLAGTRVFVCADEASPTTCAVAAIERGGVSTSPAATLRGGVAERCGEDTIGAAAGSGVLASSARSTSGSDRPRSPGDSSNCPPRPQSWGTVTSLRARTQLRAENDLSRAVTRGCRERHAPSAGGGRGGAGSSPPRARGRSRPEPAPPPLPQRPGPHAGSPRPPGAGAPLPPRRGLLRAVPQLRGGAGLG